MATFENIKLDKGLYGTGKGFLAELEKIDPSENYKGTSLENLDAFERQLKRFGIKVKGAGSDAVEKFFATTDSAVLFPEYVSRAVRWRLFRCGEDYRSTVHIVTSEHAYGAFSQRIVRHDTEESAVDAEIC